MISTLRPDQPDYRLERTDHGFILHAIEGREAQFAEVVRTLLDSVADGCFSVFPRSGSSDDYDAVEVVLNDD